MPKQQPLALPQQFGRFLVTGALTFTVVFWGLSSALMSNQEIHRDISALYLMAKSLIHQPFAAWFRDVQTAYIPFFFRQQGLLLSYCISVVLAWVTAFFFDIKILRKENLV